MQRQPILSQTCRQASTAVETRYRIQGAPVAPRATRIVAVDGRAADIVRDLAAGDWQGGRFLVHAGSAPGADASSADAWVEDLSGQRSRLSEEVDGADVVVVVATAEADAAAAGVVGDLCAARGVMSAALVVSSEADVDSAVATLRPNAMVLVRLDDATDVADMLSALRA